MPRVPLRRKHLDELGEVDQPFKRARLAKYVQDVSQNASFEPFADPIPDTVDSSDSESEISSLSSLSSISSISSLSELSSLDFEDDTDWEDADFTLMFADIDTNIARERINRLRVMRQLILSSEELRENAWVLGYYRRKVHSFWMDYGGLFGIGDQEVLEINNDDPQAPVTAQHATASQQLDS